MTEKAAPLEVDRLRELILDGEIDTVVVAFTDMQGRLQGKRIHAQFFLDTVLEHWASAEAILTEDEKEFGTALVDIGGETTNLAIYHRGAVQHTAVFPFGSMLFTKDIATGLRVSIPEATKIKQSHGAIGGKGFAIAGVIISSVILLFIIGILVLLIVTGAFHHNR